MESLDFQIIAENINDITQVRARPNSWLFVDWIHWIGGRKQFLCDAEGRKT
jgi:hypothetical protein